MSRPILSGEKGKERKYAFNLILKKINAIKFGTFKLSNGQVTPYYVELKDIPGPIGLIYSHKNDIIEKGKELVKYYSLKARKVKNVEFNIIKK